MDVFRRLASWRAFEGAKTVIFQELIIPKSALKGYTHLVFQLRSSKAGGTIYGNDLGFS